MMLISQAVERKGSKDIMNLVDWISFTLPYSSMFQKIESTSIIEIKPHIRDEYPHISDYIMSFPDLEQGRGRKMFDTSFRSSIGGFTIYQRHSLKFTLFEFSGTGCAVLRKRKSMKDFIRLYGDRFTRIDCTTDIETDVDPLEFIKNRSTERFSSYSTEKSETGVTHYVGSKTSDRFARVYRYNPPHPRSHLLRVEHVLRNDEAKNVAAIMENRSLSAVQSALGNTFGWTNSAWTEKRNDAPIKAAPRDIRQGKTERWLMSSVLPAIRRLIDEGSEETVAIFGERVYAMYTDRMRKIRGE
jgi:hypothetical protein